MSDNPIYDNLNNKDEALLPNTPGPQHAEEGPGFVARSRKAFMAGAVAFAASLAPMCVTITQDGAVTVDEIIFAGVVSLGLGFSAGFATWAVPNAE